MQLTHDTFILKWNQRFPRNDEFLITATDLQEFALDIADTFGISVANVPYYLPSQVYTAGYLVRYVVAGQAESFFYARKSGKLPAPVASGDTNWKVVPGPVPATVLWQAVSLLAAQGIEGESVQAGRLYQIDFGPDAHGVHQLVYVRGLDQQFDVLGTLEVDGVRTPVQVDVAAGTFKAVASDALSRTATTPQVVAGPVTFDEPIPAPDFSLLGTDALAALDSLYKISKAVEQGEASFGQLSQAVATLQTAVAGLLNGAPEELNTFLEAYQHWQTTQSAEDALMKLITALQGRVNNNTDAIGALQIFQSGFQGNVLVLCNGLAPAAFDTPQQALDGTSGQNPVLFLLNSYAQPLVTSKSCTVFCGTSLLGQLNVYGNATVNVFGSIGAANQPFAVLSNTTGAAVITGSVSWTPTANNQVGISNAKGRVKITGTYGIVNSSFTGIQGFTQSVVTATLEIAEGITLTGAGSLGTSSANVKLRGRSYSTDKGLTYTGGTLDLFASIDTTAATSPATAYPLTLSQTTNVGRVNVRAGAELLAPAGVDAIHQTTYTSSFTPVLYLSPAVPLSVAADATKIALIALGLLVAGSSAASPVVGFTPSGVNTAYATFDAALQDTATGNVHLSTNQGNLTITQNATLPNYVAGNNSRVVLADGITVNSYASRRNSDYLENISFRWPGSNTSGTAVLMGQPATAADGSQLTEQYCGQWVNVTSNPTVTQPANCTRVYFNCQLNTLNGAGTALFYGTTSVTNLDKSGGLVVIDRTAKTLAAAAANSGNTNTSNASGFQPTTTGDGSKYLNDKGVYAQPAGSTGIDYANELSISANTTAAVNKAYVLQGGGCVLSLPSGAAIGSAISVRVDDAASALFSVAGIDGNLKYWAGESVVFRYFSQGWRIATRTMRAMTAQLQTLKTEQPSFGTGGGFVIPYSTQRTLIGPAGLINLAQHAIVVQRDGKGSISAFARFANCETEGFYYLEVTSSRIGTLTGVFSAVVKSDTSGGYQAIGSPGDTFAVQAGDQLTATLYTQGLSKAPALLGTYDTGVALLSFNESF